MIASTALKPIYDQGGITLHCGDNVETLRMFAADSIDLTVTSPPYDQLRTYGGHAWGWDNFVELAPELYRVTKPGGVVVWIVNDATVDGSETGTSFRQALHFKECGFNLETMIWAKDGGGAVGSNRLYTQNTEFMFVLSRGTVATSNLLKDKRQTSPGRCDRGGAVGRRSADGSQNIETRQPRADFARRNNWWPIPEVGTSVDHPAPFPEALARDHILSWSNEGDTVLDPFCGSGTTPKMAKLMGRKCIGIEINEDYIPIQIKRLRQGVLEFT